MHAALVGNADSVKLILEAGYFDPALRDHSGNAPIHYGAMSGDVKTLGKSHQCSPHRLLAYNTDS